MKKYDPKKIENKWQRYWEKHPELYRAKDADKKPKAYILDMFPYPSAAGLHTGHIESYAATDIISRYLRMNGKNVLHPQGWDAFGLPAENYAIKTKVHPAITTKKAIANFKRQMKMMGLSYDWSREINSSDPSYYKWTQWFFSLLYKNNLAYKAKAKVNWCDSCQTVLANEQAEGGICERCKNPVLQKDLEQWFFKIKDFADDLIKDLNKVDWPESTKIAQRNWIGKSEGAQFQMKIVKSSQKENKVGILEVFTTRLDTVFGMTFALVAPEHKLIQNLKTQITNWAEVEKYINAAKKKTDLQRQTGAKEKIGAELKGVKIINPFTKKELPLFISDFILAHYGTGAVMAVPAHDQRDFEFAKKYGLNIIEVVVQTSNEKFTNLQEAFTDDGVLVNSDEYTDLTSEQAREKMTEWLEKEKIGKKVVNYKIRDWLISRQRYWGAPIPIIYCDKCTEVLVPEKDLPVKLPTDIDFMPTGESPLARSKKFHNVKCPKCGSKARRESDTMDTFVCSSWYYLRYADPKNKKEPFNKLRVKKWLPVDLYVGGAEHVVLHLLYSRFFTKVLYRLGYINFDEPFLKLRHQGIILGEDGRKMSKSLGNVVNPDDVVKKYGVDALRMYEMFMGPLEDMKPWNTQSIMGIYRFLERAHKIIFNPPAGQAGFKSASRRTKKTDQKLESLFNKTIKKVGEDIEALKFNTAISALMILLNEMEKAENLSRSNLEIFLKILSPFAPHLTEELWSDLGFKKSIHLEKWPKTKLDIIRREEVDLIVQFNGKFRGTIKISLGVEQKEVEERISNDVRFKKYLNGKPERVIFIENKLINLLFS